jgi:hypothetical protein
MIRRYIGLAMTAMVALSLAAATQSSAQTYSDTTVCRRALNFELSGWVEDSFYAEEANKRGLTLETCRQLTAQNPPAPPAKSAEGQGASSSEMLKPYADKSHPSLLEAGISTFPQQRISDEA